MASLLTSKQKQELYVELKFGSATNCHLSVLSDRCCCPETKHYWSTCKRQAIPLPLKRSSEKQA